MHSAPTPSQGELDVVIRGATVFTMDAHSRVLNAEVGIAMGCIVYVGKRPGSFRVTRRTQHIHGKGSVLLPGFVQCHVHLVQTLFRGMAEGLPLLHWLSRRIWPLEASLTRSKTRQSAELGLKELINGGTTCILDMGSTQHHGVVFDAIARSGMRAFSGKAMMDRGPAALRETTQQSIAESMALLMRWHGACEGRLGYAFAPRFVLSCSKTLLRKVGVLAKQTGTLIHTHIAENEKERHLVRERYGKSDVQVLEDLGIAGPHVVLAHGVWLNKKEMRRIAKRETRIVHCPSANLKLASGIADVKAMREAEIVVGLGADGAACNNRLDMWSEMRLSGLLAKVRRRDPAAISAMDILRMATWEGARLLNLEQLIGSIEVGKRADLILVRIDPSWHLPGQDLSANLVYACTQSHVSHVMIDGQMLKGAYAPAQKPLAGEVGQA
ncbi:MAG: amidohydrolase family protein [Myxococcales bacterium]|nr:amidohydrolase family protein [Myxococcales bacterium]